MEDLKIGVVLLVSALYVIPGTFVVSMTLTRLMVRMAPLIGLTDRPDGHRKLHVGATPVAGGVAVFLATAMIVLGLAIGSTPWRAELQGDARQQLALLAASASVVALGLLDDWVGMRGRHKLLGQTGVALIVVMGGLVIHRFELFGISVDFGVFAVPMTVLWLVGAINSVNLLDGIDGLATTIGIILSATIGVLAAMTGHYAVTVVAWAFASGLFGFLMFNLPPAKIFLGDTGSMLIGLVVGTLAIRGSLKGPGTVLLTAPLAIWTIPALDTLAAIVRRKLTGRSIFATDRGHLHHRMMATLGSNRGVLACVAICCIATSVAALISVFQNDDTIALVTCGAIVAVLVATGLFGRAEVELLAAQVQSVGTSLASAWNANPVRSGRRLTRFRGSERWRPLWNRLTEAGEQRGLGRIKVDLHVPATNEAFNADWQWARVDEPEQCWRVELPLIVAGRVVGRLVADGRVGDSSSVPDIEQILGLLASTQSQILALVNDRHLPLSDRPARAGRSRQRGECVTSSLVQSLPK